MKPPIDQLKRFLVQAKKATYASGDRSQEVKESDKSTSLKYSNGEWQYHDNYFGGEPFGGREVVFHKGKPVYIMVYYGWVVPEVEDPKGIYQVLQAALRQIPDGYHYRGPKELKQGNFQYVNSFTGEIDRFSGEEIIYQNGQEVYRARYSGGLVDQRRE